MGKLLEQLKQECTQCSERVFAKRIIGRYLRTNTRILIWECPECGYLWQRTKSE